MIITHVQYISDLSIIYGSGFPGVQLLCSSPAHKEWEVFTLEALTKLTLAYA